MGDCNPALQGVQALTVGAQFVYQFVQADGVTPVDITGATGIKMKFGKPDGTTVDKTAAILNMPGTDGKIQYTTIANDLDQSGPWTIQGWIVLGGNIKPGTVAQFNVLGNVDNT